MRLSIVASVRNRLGDTRRWLESIAQQENIGQIDVQLVNFGSIDDMEQVRHQGVSMQIIDVPYHPGPYPEWWLKNIGIKHATGEVVLCTNVDIVYAPDFMHQVMTTIRPGMLVQALRLDATKGVAVNPNASMNAKGDEKGVPVSLVVDHEGLYTPTTACGDCQALHQADWKYLRGYDEEMAGWGGGDQDLTCRVLGSGMDLHIMGYSHARHIHAWHPNDEQRKIVDGRRNGELLRRGMAEASFIRNPDTWGKLP